MFKVKFSPTAFNFGYDFVLLVHFFGTPCRDGDDDGDDADAEKRDIRQILAGAGQVGSLRR